VVFALPISVGLLLAIIGGRLFLTARAEARLRQRLLGVGCANGIRTPIGLSVNVSPSLIIAGESLRAMVALSRRSLVLEVTEHVGIADYEAFRAAVRLRPHGALGGR
jgi:EAL domain-containing protein (putative c-di-GMP-specific phosphodiesterase class I)